MLLQLPEIRVRQQQCDFNYQGYRQGLAVGLPVTSEGFLSPRQEVDAVRPLSADIMQISTGYFEGNVSTCESTFSKSLSRFCLAVGFESVDHHADQQQN